MTAALRCYICRRLFGQVPNMPFPVVYEFCPDCVSLMTYDFERQMKNLPALSLLVLKEIGKARQLKQKQPP